MKFRGNVMNINQLNNQLFSLTTSEKFHLKYPNSLSRRYNRIQKTTLNGEELYLFKFDSLMQERNICLNRESRYTPIPKHIHAVIELNYVYRGTFTQIINGTELTLQEGDVCILDMNTAHEILPLSDKDIIITIDMRKKYFIDSFLARLSTQGLVSKFLVEALSESHHTQKFLIFKKQPDIDIHSVIQQLLCEYYDTKICSNEIIDSYMVILFSLLLRMYQNQTNSDTSNTAHDEILLLILKYMESNYKTVTLESLAELFGFHPNYLSSYIKKHTGKSYKDLIITQRMLQAGFYLKNSSLPIQEIAHEVGYQNLGFFYKKFQEHYHISPTEFKRNG